MKRRTPRERAEELQAAFSNLQRGRKGRGGERGGRKEGRKKGRKEGEEREGRERRRAGREGQDRTGLGRGKRKGESKKREGGGKPRDLSSSRRWGFPKITDETSESTSRGGKEKKVTAPPAAFSNLGRTERPGAADWGSAGRGGGPGLGSV